MATFQVYPLRLLLPHFFRLQHCFAPLTPSLALVYREAIALYDLSRLDSDMEIIPVCYADALEFGCAVIGLPGKKVVVPRSAVDVRSYLF